MGKSDKLTEKQLKFIEAFDGNATEAARKAGYKGNYATLGQVGQENLKKPLVISAIRERQNKRLKPLIATREERQAFWTAVMNSKKEMMMNRLRASELLGKSEADFIDRHQLSGPNGGPIQTQKVLTKEERRARIAELESIRKQRG